MGCVSLPPDLPIVGSEHGSSLGLKIVKRLVLVSLPFNGSEIGGI